jgi:transcriptional regulator with GAF, ATPase, and Fis domain
VADESDLQRELEEARASLARQAMQIDRMQREAEPGGSAAVFRELLHLSEVVGATVGETPYRALLNGIIEAAKRLFDAAAASIALLDHETNELVFAAAAESSLIGMRFPAHQGIAGWVMMTGEPMAVGDVRRDPRFANDFAQSTGYVPRSILAVPMFVGDEVEGVLSVLDKASAATFGLDDMELLGLFARPAAIAVEQARMVGSIGTMLVGEMERLAREEGATEISDGAVAALAGGSSASDQTLQLARLVNTLGRRSDRSREMAIEILSAVARLSS